MDNIKSYMNQDLFHIVNGGLRADNAIIIHILYAFQNWDRIIPYFLVQMCTQMHFCVYGSYAHGTVTLFNVINAKAFKDKWAFSTLSVHVVGFSDFQF